MHFFCKNTKTLSVSNLKQRLCLYEFEIEEEILLAAKNTF
jgi:hypothetical protein